MTVFLVLQMKSTMYIQEPLSSGVLGPGFPKCCGELCLFLHKQSPLLFQQQCVEASPQPPIPRQGPQALKQFTKAGLNKFKHVTAF